jgi:dolichol kinase
MADVVGTAILFAYYIVFAALIPIVMRLCRVPGEWIRKTQHVVYALSLFLMLRLFTRWYWAILGGASLIAVAYPVLLGLERSPRFRRLFVSRPGERGELRRQLLTVQVTFALLILVFWGLLGYHWHHVAVAAVMAWGFGDAAAALAGQAFGRRRIVHRLIEGTKTYVGTFAMAAAAAPALFLTLMFYGGQPWYTCLTVATVVAPACAVVELFSRRGTDTLTVPLAAAALTAPLVYALSLIP